ncbi:MAG: imidazole glycerol phosphate synthase subunit HisH [Shewanella sp.]
MQQNEQQVFTESLNKDLKTEQALTQGDASPTALGDTVIIDTGCANLSSVRFALLRLGAKVQVSDDIAKIKAAKRVVLPGVGTAGAAMAALQQKGLIELIQGLTQPVLGICLGMQMLTALSHERGASNQDCPCLGIIPTDIAMLDANLLKAQGLPLPHMGWNQLTLSPQAAAHPLFAGVQDVSYVYFVHSYRAPISPFTLAKCHYGETFSAAIGKDNFMGVQFHPEKSAAVGAQILRNFLSMGDKCDDKLSHECLAMSQLDRTDLAATRDQHGRTLKQLKETQG